MAISLQIRYLKKSLVTTTRFGDKKVELDQEGPEPADLYDLTCKNLIQKWGRKAEINSQIRCLTRKEKQEQAKWRQGHNFSAVYSKHKVSIFLSQFLNHTSDTPHLFAMIWAVSRARFKSDEYTAEIAVSFESRPATYRKGKQFKKHALL